MTRPKPPHGTPCNNCGQCCADQRCPLGLMMFGPGGRCPALELAFNGMVCGLVRDPKRYAPAVVAAHGLADAARAAGILIGAGMGCDALLEGESPNFAWRAWAMIAVDGREIEAARLIWMTR